jgi:Amt family ammonium transporter
MMVELLLEKTSMMKRVVPPAAAALAALAASVLAWRPLAADAAQSILPTGAAPIAAAPLAALNTGDTAFVLIAAALVLLMTPGLGLFYGGMVRRKNVLATITQSFAMMAVVSILWVTVGYSLSFGPDIHGLIGSLAWLGLTGVGQAPNPAYAATIPHLAFMAFQMKFAIITPALIAGAFAERMKFSAFLLFSILWTLLVYTPVCHWIWGLGGFIRAWGFLDFAGGTVVHILSGFSALTAAIYIGKRKGLGEEDMVPHNMTMVMMGTGMLWFGWFGFNAGSSLGANGVAVAAFVNTNTAAAAAALSWTLLEWWVKGKPTAFGLASGMVAGLAGVTQAAGYITPMSAVLVGLLVAPACFGAILLKNRLGYDDALDAFGVHGIAGVFGALATGLFACKAVNPSGDNGLFYGNPHLLLVQVKGAALVAVFAIIMTWIIMKLVDLLVGVRVSPREEELGLDLTQHGESGYEL